MQITDTVTLAAPRDRVIAALTDPATLQACIPGCSEVTKAEGNRYEVEVSIPTGLRPMRFRGTMRMDKSGLPDRVTYLRGPKGKIDITLDAAGDTTVLHYMATAHVTGKVALLGNRMLTGMAGRMAAGFFDRLGTQLAGRPPRG